jgi:hypothetical protein
MKVLHFLPVLIAGTFAQTSLPNLLRQPMTQRDKTCEEKYCNYACLEEIFLVRYTIILDNRLLMINRNTTACEKMRKHVKSAVAKVS